MEHPLTAYRAANGLTLEAFGNIVGATKGTVWKWENGKAIPRPPYMRKISESTSYSVSPNDWYGQISGVAS